MHSALETFSIKADINLSFRSVFAGKPFYPWKDLHEESYGLEVELQQSQRRGAFRIEKGVRSSVRMDKLPSVKAIQFTLVECMKLVVTNCCGFINDIPPY